MNFSFELSWALLTGSLNQESMTWIGAIAWAVLGWLSIIAITILLAITVLMIVSWWRVFKKAGLPGWGIFIPFYNRYLMFKLGGRSGRNFLWIFIPPVFVILMIINVFNITERFWKHWTFGLGIIFLKFIFIPILAFDDSTYLGNKMINKQTTRPIAQRPMAKTPAKKKAPAKRIIKRTIKKAPVKKVKTITKKK